MDQIYDVPFSPYVDIGWRLGRAFWGKGYAAEGAKRCLPYGFDELKLYSIKATAPLVNTRSIGVMEKIDMKKKFVFEHPKLTSTPYLNPCVCYQISRK